MSNIFLLKKNELVWVMHDETQSLPAAAKTSELSEYHFKPQGP